MSTETLDSLFSPHLATGLTTLLIALLLLYVTPEGERTLPLPATRGQSPTFQNSLKTLHSM